MFCKWSSWIFLLLLFAACGGHDGSSTYPLAAATPLETNSKAQILNNIVVHEKGGLIITRAFLSDGNGMLLNAQNNVKENEAVLLNLVIKEGWILNKGTVSIGAAQEITTATGEPVLSAPDLFAQEPRYPAAKASFLQLRTAITKTRFDNRDFVVHYRVWDKNGPGEVAGRYNLSLQTAAAK